MNYNAHNFAAGAPQNRRQVPLTLDQVAKIAPSALATRPYAGMSSKYAMIPTIDVVNGMIAHGFMPFSASESRTRIEAKAGFTKHLIRFRHQDVAQSLVVGPATQETSLAFGSSTVDVLSTLDSLGRPYLTQVRQGPSSSSFDTTATGYDAPGRPASFSVPCTSGASTSCRGAAQTLTLGAGNRPITATDAGNGYINFAYAAYPAGGVLPDILVSILPSPIGETATGKQEQLEHDAFNRLKSVCEMTTAAGSGTCGQSITQTGYWTKYGYDVLGRLTSVAQNAQSASPQSRVFTYDGFSRITTKNEPESGLTQYFYDSAPSTPGVACAGTYNGDLVKVYDANGNTICYTYDPLHRKTSASYSGPNATGTNAYFVYDSATVNAVAMTNTAGRLAEAYTATCSTCAKITDLGFSYSARGELTDTYESTPHSGGYYHVAATYYPSGVLNSLSGVPGQTAWTYGLDGEGRPNTLTHGTATLVKSVSYDNAGSPLQINYGNGDSDQYQYDAVERMNKYVFTVGTAKTTVSGTPKWNQNGTLQALAIVDGFNSANSQICNYLYDDLVRIASASCGAAWAQSFNYDPFGNISKGGSSTFQAQYSSATNRITSLPGVTVSYDSNGNLTGDGTHTYKWDAENRARSVDAATLTYDALGRVAEVNATNPVLYGPLGKIGLMHGQTVTRIYIPLPGGGRLEYHSGTLIHHRDWLGTARLVTLYSTRTNTYDSAYAPFGENYAGLGTPDYDFTGQTEDTVSGTQGLYDFLYRKYSPVQGRWISPDPGGLNVVDPSHPQTWNAYAYVSNNPLSNTDPLGLDGCAADSSSDMIDCSFSYNGSTDSSSGWESTLSWMGSPFNADPLANIAGGSDPLWNLSNMPPGTVASGPAAGLNPATGQDSSDINISSDIANNAAVLAPAMSRGAAIVNTFVAADTIMAGTTASVAAGPTVASAGLNTLARGTGWAYAYMGPAAATVIGRYGKVVGDYVTTARIVGANALNLPTPIAHFFEDVGAWRTLNIAYLDAQIFRGTQFYLTNVPLNQEGSNFAMELEYLWSRGIGPQQWRYVPVSLMQY